MQTAIIVPAEFKFADGGEAGTFEGYASVYGNQDSHGDVVEPGAFKEHLGRAQGAEGERNPLDARCSMACRAGLSLKGHPGRRVDRRFPRKTTRACVSPPAKSVRRRKHRRRQALIREGTKTVRFRRIVDRLFSKRPGVA